jgi:hypothetical protein
MSNHYEIFSDKRQQLVSLQLFFEFGELDFARLKQMAADLPELQALVDNSSRVGKLPNTSYYLVPVEVPQGASVSGK